MARITRTCPRCGQAYSQPPVISRKDNATAICPRCGIKEALASLGISEEDQQKIVEEAMAVYKEK